MNSEREHKLMSIMGRLIVSAVLVTAVILEVDEL